MKSTSLNSAVFFKHTPSKSFSAIQALACSSYEENSNPDFIGSPANLKAYKIFLSLPKLGKIVFSKSYMKTKI